MFFYFFYFKRIKVLYKIIPKTYLFYIYTIYLNQTKFILYLCIFF